mmetsp:Transcript_65201/g.180873  ORF Transcript_65201/g.180873 Transcript_65201/m.180873 type:complete len:326 (-) Transcript_65201:62-1039(-)
MGERRAFAVHGSMDSCGFPSTEGSGMLHSQCGHKTGRSADPNLYPGVTAIANIGEGSFGEVYRCYVDGMEGEVAMKCIKPWVSKKALREAETLGKAEHSNIVKLLSILRIDGHDPPALVLELCLGGTLAELLHGTAEIPPKPMRLTQRLQACLEVAHAISHLHARHIMHRDVKTPNVFLADVVVPDGEGITLPPMKLGDLGCAKCTDDDSELNTQGTGTLAYMAPEVLAGDLYCTSADIFSFAILLHETVSGELPYGLSEDPRLALKIAKGFRPAKEALPDGPAGDSVFGLLEQCWCSDPEDRLPAPDVTSQLEALLATFVDATG